MLDKITLSCYNTGVKGDKNLGRLATGFRDTDDSDYL